MGGYGHRCVCSVWCVRVHVRKPGRGDGTCVAHVCALCVCGLCASCVAERGCLWGVSTRAPACVTGVFAGRTGGVGVEAWVCVCDVFVPLTICDLCVHVRVAVCVCVHGMCRWPVGVSVCGNG